VAIAIVTAINANMTHVTASRPIGALPQAVKLRSDAYLFRAVQARNDNVTATGFTVVTGAHRFYLGRGYRVSARHNELIIILPYGTPTSVQQAVADMARQLKAGGVDVIIEVRANP
jgi:hypothetical protein